MKAKRGVEQKEVEIGKDIQAEILDAKKENTRAEVCFHIRACFQ